MLKLEQAIVINGLILYFYWTSIRLYWSFIDLSLLFQY